MKKLVLSLVCGVLVFGMSASDAFAIKAFKDHFEKMYVQGNDNAQFVAAVEDAKCNVCHYGKSKKNRNDYGKALSELLDKNDFKTSRVKAMPVQVDKELTEAFKKVEEMKSTGGETFGALIKAGKLPGTAPEGEE